MRLNFVTYVNDHFDALLGDRVEADDATFEGLEELGNVLPAHAPCQQRRSRRGKASSPCKPRVVDQLVFLLFDCIHKVQSLLL